MNQTKRGRTLTLYRDDITVQVRYDGVKGYFFTANNTVLTISRYDDEESDTHHYIHWPRERFVGSETNHRRSNGFR